MSIIRAPSDSRPPSGGLGPDRGAIETAVARLEGAVQQRPLPRVAQRLLVDALHERASLGEGVTEKAISDAWHAIRGSLRLDPQARPRTPLAFQTFGFLAAKYLGTGGPLTAERIRAIDRQNAEPMRLAAAPRAPWKMGEQKHLIDLARDALGPSRALDFTILWESWVGTPVGDPSAPDRSTCVQQRTFTRVPWKDKLATDDVMRVLRGEVLIMENPRTGQLDFIAREHNTIDVLLAAWALGRAMPERILHFDRHSDYTLPHADEKTFGARHLAGVPQASVWWSLLDVIKRADGEAPLADPASDVVFVTHLAPNQDGQKLTGARMSPLPARDTRWPRAAEKFQTAKADFVSYDLDLSMPSDQMNGTKEMLRDPRFREAMSAATTRLFVISPQFSGGGDEVKRPHATHSPATYTRVLNVVRRANAGRSSS